MQELLGEWNDLAKSTLLGCESAAAEAFIGNLRFSDNRYEINYEYGVSVPLYAYLYHEYLRNFMGNQVESYLEDANENTFLYRLAYSFSIGDSMSLVLTEDGEILSRWGLRDFSHLPNKKTVLTLVRNLVAAYKGAAGKYLYNARMIPTPEIVCDRVVFARRGGKSAIDLPSILSSAWETEEGERAVVLVNPSKGDARCTVDGKEVALAPLSCVVLEL